MKVFPSRSAVLAAAALGSVAAVLAAAMFALRPGSAEAQGVMSVPACQCSAPTVIPGMSSSVVHCICGGMSCVVSEHTGPGKNTNLMQCVK